MQSKEGVIDLPYQLDRHAGNVPFCRQFTLSSLHQPPSIPPGFFGEILCVGPTEV